jgi:hypothetical protein
MIMPGRPPLTEEERAERRGALHAARKAAKNNLQDSGKGVNSEKSAGQKQASSGPATGSIRSDVDRQKQRRRNGFAGNAQQMGVIGTIPGWTMRIFNDDPGRIEYAQSCGWEFVIAGEVEMASSNKVVDPNGDLGGRIRWHTKGVINGQPQYAFLMKIPDQFWNEDHEDQQDQIYKRERQMIERGGIDVDRIKNATLPPGRKQALEIGTSLDVRRPAFPTNDGRG